MELWLVALEWFTVIVTIVVTLAGLPACVKMYQTKSTDNVPFALFLVFAFVATLSVQYGMILNNTAMVFVNGFALMVWIAYISVYILVTQAKANAFMKASAILVLYWGHLQYLARLPQENVLPTLGIYMVVWCTILSILPCSDILGMIESKSSACCDMPMLYASTLSCVTWVFYGWAINDLNILLSALPGLVVNIIKFIFVFIVYPTSNRNVEKVVREPTKEEDSNGNIATDFHEKAYNVDPGGGLLKRSQ